jgi:hypothetical protein
LLYAAYPVIALLAHNLGESRLSVGYRSLILSIVGTACFLLIFTLFFRNRHKAAILCTIVVILFFSYGQIYAVLEQGIGFGINLGRHRILLPFYGAILILGFLWVVKRIKNPEQISEVMNIIGIFTLVIPVFKIITFQINASQSWQNETTVLSDNRKDTTEGNNQPDIYYIVLDAYARGDSLLEYYGYDNSTFLDQLEALGFYVAECSQSNYAKTRLSLASTLNMNYLEAFDKIAQDLERGRENRIRMGQLIKKNEVRKILQEKGYSIVAFETGYLWSEWENADIYFSQTSDSTLKNSQLFGRVNEFESLLFKTSLGLVLMDAETILTPMIKPVTISSPRRSHYDYILYTLNIFEEISGVQGPKFVFAHLISPHGPYVFDAMGNFIPDENDTSTGYIDQVKYLNTRLIPILDKLIQNSEIPPIIIIQADHGGHGTQFDPDHRMNILNVYYLPDGGDQLLYQSISPVNSFRIIMDYYFDSDYGLLEDLSYYSSIDGIFDFLPLTNTCTEK